MTRWILASASPRRRELLQQMGLQFEVIPARGEESSRKTDPEEFVMELARNKAGEVFFRELRSALPSDDAKDTICVIGADTVVVLEDCILGKPKDREDAADMLRRLQGRTHRVLTGVSILWADKSALSGHVSVQRAEQISSDFHEETFFVETGVHVSPMDEEEIAAYLATGEADDKAGAYGIQGAFGIYIEGISGDYYNVVGLPISALYHVLRRVGLLGPGYISCPAAK